MRFKRGVLYKWFAVEGQGILNRIIKRDGDR
jgi:hypothetical protein